MGNTKKWKDEDIIFILTANLDGLVLEHIAEELSRVTKQEVPVTAVRYVVQTYGYSAEYGAPCLTQIQGPEQRRNGINPAVYNFSQLPTEENPNPKVVLRIPRRSTPKGWKFTSTHLSTLKKDSQAQHDEKEKMLKSHREWAHLVRKQRKRPRTALPESPPMKKSRRVSMPSLADITEKRTLQKAETSSKQAFIAIPDDPGEGPSSDWIDRPEPPVKIERSPSLIRTPIPRRQTSIMDAFTKAASREEAQKAKMATVYNQKRASFPSAEALRASIRPACKQAAQTVIMNDAQRAMQTTSNHDVFGIDAMLQTSPLLTRQPQLWSEMQQLKTAPFNGLQYAMPNAHLPTGNMGQQFVPATQNPYQFPFTPMTPSMQGMFNTMDLRSMLNEPSSLQVPDTPISEVRTSTTATNAESVAASASMGEDA
ncbi:hypothetical protein VHEMI04911 [[Torrubiella] hemipterigena]|uniref:Uncharacterized protein n=1 Tax=[Torrubiella] hemipterigena TaxID=1531966 RepID=A0A0A1TFN4_9HYPO|nr:hypothetical protein VHEMI04911 [[Torrubiella] hemipterigena]